MTDPTNEDFGSIPISGPDSGKNNDVAADILPDQDIDTGQQQPKPPPRTRRRIASPRRRWPYWLLSILVLGLALFFAGGYLLVPYLTTTFLADRLADRIGRPVTIAKAQFDPLTFTLSLQNAIIGAKTADPEDQVDPILSLSRATIDFEAMGLFTGRLIAKKVATEQLFIHLVRDKKGGYNLRQMAAKALPMDENTSLVYSLNNITISDSRLVFDDLPAGKSHEAEAINLAVPSLSNISYQAGQYIRPKFSATINGSPIELTGETTMKGKALEAKLAINLKTIDLPRYLVYLPESWRIKATQGKASLIGDLIFGFEPGKDLRLAFQGTGSMTGLTIEDREGNLNKIASASFDCNLAPRQDQYLFKEIRVVQPELHLDRNKNGQWNLLHFSSTAAEKESGQQDAHLQIGRLLLQNSILHITDRQVAGGFKDTWSSVQFSLQGYNNQEDKPAAFAMSGVSNGQARFSAQGTMQAKSRQAEGLLVAHQLNLGRLNPYLNDLKRFRLTSGTATKLESRFSWDMSAGGLEGVVLTDLACLTEKIALNRGDSEWFRAPHLQIKAGAIDWRRKKVNLGAITTAQSFILCSWDKDGGFNWFSTPESGKHKAWQLRIADLKAENSTIALTSKAMDKEAFSETLQEGRLHIEMTDPAGKKGRIKAAAKLGAKGEIHLAGDLSLAPFTATLSGELTNYNITNLNKPYLADLLKPQVTAGLLQAKGSFTYPAPAFAGSFAMDNIIGSSGKKEAFRIKRATADTARFTWQQRTLAINHLELAGSQLNHAITKDKGLSLGLFSDKEAAARSGIDIKEISITQGAVLLHDTRLNPQFTMNIDRVTGAIKGFANRPDNRCKLDLTGTIEGKSPVILAGEFAFFGKEPAFTCNIGLTGVKLAKLAPYTDSILGYRTTAGSIKVATIAERKDGALTANSQLTVEGLRLGARLDGNRQLPLLAALLSDTQERITMNIPIQSSPPSRDAIRQGIAKHIRGLLAKAAVSPATVLRQSFPDLAADSHLAFAPGKVEVAVAHNQPLARLAEVLKNRPQLKVIITGLADDTADRMALLEKLRKSEEEKRLQQQAKLSQTLTATYGKEEIVRPGGAVSEETIFDESSIKNEELLALAKSRAENTAKYLNATFGLAPGRIETGFPQLLTRESLLADKSRVNFSFDLLGGK